MQNLYRSLANCTILIVAVGLFGACNDVKFDYSTPPALDIVGSTALAVGVLDHRQYVVTGEKRPSYVGSWFHNLGVPFYGGPCLDLETQSGHALADDFADSIAQSLSAKGFKVAKVTLTPTISNDEALAQAIALDADRTILLEVKEWKMDTCGVSALYYSLSLGVYYDATKRLAFKELSGRDWMFKTSLLQSGVFKAGPEEFRKKIAQLFDNSEVKVAMAAGAMVPTETESAPSIARVDRRLERRGPDACTVIGQPASEAGYRALRQELDQCWQARIVAAQGLCKKYFGVAEPPCHAAQEAKTYRDAALAAYDADWKQKTAS